MFAPTKSKSSSPSSITSTGAKAGLLAVDGQASEAALVVSGPVRAPRPLLVAQSASERGVERTAHVRPKQQRVTSDGRLQPAGGPPPPGGGGGWWGRGGGG